MAARGPALLLLLAGCATGPGEGQTPLLAGVAVIEITPSRNIPLGGYSARRGKPMIGVHDPLYAKALWLETPDTKVCLVTTDLIGSLLAIRDRIQPPDASVILTASHTHSGPGALHPSFLWQIALGKYDPAVYEELVGKLQRVVEQARADRRPAGLAIVRGEAPGLSKNRRRKGGPVDPELGVLLVTDNLSRPRALVANYAAHPTVLGDECFLASADWPGALQRALEGRFPGAVAMFVNGAEGDLAPRAPGGRDDFEEARALGEALAERAANLAAAIEKTSAQVRIKYVERGVDLPNPTLPTVPKRSVLGVLQIDGTRMFCVPGEPGVELGLELKKRHPGAWILGLANDHLGYLLTREDYARGGYERTVSFYGAGMGPWLVERLAELVVRPGSPPGEGNDAEDRAGQPEGRRGQDHDRRQP